jgi:hypothetical protein
MAADDDSHGMVSNGGRTTQQLRGLGQDSMNLCTLYPAPGCPGGFPSSSAASPVYAPSNITASWFDPVTGKSLAQDSSGTIWDLTTGQPMASSVPSVVG